MVEKHKQLIKDQASSRTRDYLNELRMQNIFVNLENNILFDSVNNTLNYAQYMAYPMFLFHYPDIFRGVGDRIKMPEFIFSDDFSDLFIKIQSDIEKILDEFIDDDTVSSRQTKYLILRFPNPDESFPGTNLGYPVADLARSKKIWTAIFGDNPKDSVDIDIYLSDFYQAGINKGSLNCSNIKPIITDSMLSLAFKRNASYA